MMGYNFDLIHNHQEYTELDFLGNRTNNKVDDRETSNRPVSS